MSNQFCRSIFTYFLKPKVVCILICKDNKMAKQQQPQRWKKHGFMSCAALLYASKNCLRLSNLNLGGFSLLQNFNWNDFISGWKNCLISILYLQTRKSALKLEFKKYLFFLFFVLLTSSLWVSSQKLICHPRAYFTSLGLIHKYPEVY